jgi:hypothetical protein
VIFLFIVHGNFAFKRDVDYGFSRYAFVTASNPTLEIPLGDLENVLTGVFKLSLDIERANSQTGFLLGAPWVGCHQLHSVLVTSDEPLHKVNCVERRDNHFVLPARILDVFLCVLGVCEDSDCITGFTGEDGCLE